MNDEVNKNEKVYIGEHQSSYLFNDNDYGGDDKIKRYLGRIFAIQLS